ncbi:hypothetical protein ACWGJ9_08745 [Curtobacterium citreum]
MLRQIRAALRSDSGEASAISIVIGTLLFLTASAGSVAILGNIMAATAVTRQNSIIEGALQQQLQDFESSSFEVARQTFSPTTTTVRFGGRDVPVTMSQTATTAPAETTRRVAAPMATVGGATPADCSTATTSAVAGCMSFFATRSPSPQDAADPTPAGANTLQAFPGLSLGPKTVNTSQNALTIINVNPSKVLTTDPVRIQASVPSSLVPNTVSYGFFCGSSTTPVAQYVATGQTYLSDTALILELNPSTLKSVSGCTSATVGLWSGSSAVAATSISNIYWWRILPVKGASE